MQSSLFIFNFSNLTKCSNIHQQRVDKGNETILTTALQYSNILQILFIFLNEC